jgi:hypothetical protein
MTKSLALQIAPVRLNAIAAGFVEHAVVGLVARR